jgi:hypothetical protein
MSITYRTDDLSKWGFGKGSDLDAVEVDLNFWDLDLRVATLEASTLGKQIDFMFDSGGNLYVQYTDHTIDGPFPIPFAAFRWTGSWVPSFSYSEFDVFTINNGVYLVILATISDTTFDAGANDGNGHNFYQLMFQMPNVETVTFTGDTLTLDLTYANKYIRCTNTFGCDIYYPPASSVQWVANTEIHFRDETESGGGLFFHEVSPAVINPVENRLLQTALKGAVVGSKYVGTDSWDMWGLLALAV